MPAKGSARGRSAEQMQQLSANRVKLQANAMDGTSQIEVTNLQDMLAVCELKLKAVEDRCEVLESDLQAEREKSAALNKALDLEKERSKILYQNLRVERRARQRGNTRKTVLERQISMLKSASMSSEVRKMKDSASKAIDALVNVEKENSNLRSELSKTLERCTAEAAQNRQKLHHVGKQAREFRSLAAKLQKRCDRAAAIQEKVVKRAREKASKKSTVHRLLHKGVYTEDTRNLIRLLVQAGCSRSYVGEVIHAILRTAGISTHGDISRRTVSRVVLEGYYAAQVQLGYEMNSAKSKLNIFPSLI
jgi:hypothetical protein